MTSHSALNERSARPVHRGSTRYAKRNRAKEGISHYGTYTVTPVHLSFKSIPLSCASCKIKCTPSPG